MALSDVLERIDAALAESSRILADFTPGKIDHRLKDGGDPVTEADVAVNDALLRLLPQGDDGWLSEETADDASRLERQRVWVVDPLDGTREFVEGIPEWCVSIGLVENGEAVAGGILNRVTGQKVVGAVGEGVLLNGSPCRTRDLSDLQGVEVLASRSEVRRGEWDRFAEAPFRVRPMGSVAYKLGLVAAGLSDATWTLVPKHEWDVAAGAALVRAAGGEVWLPSGEAPVFNRPVPKFTGFLAAPAALARPIREYLGQH